MKSDGTIRSRQEVREILAERGIRISRTRVMQLEQRAVRKLRKGLREIAIEHGVINPDEAPDD